MTMHTRTLRHITAARGQIKLAIAQVTADLAPLVLADAHLELELRALHQKSAEQQAEQQADQPAPQAA